MARWVGRGRRQLVPDNALPRARARPEDLRDPRAENAGGDASADEQTARPKRDRHPDPDRRQADEPPPGWDGSDDAGKDAVLSHGGREPARVVTRRRRPRSGDRAWIGALEAGLNAHKDAFPAMVWDALAGRLIADGMEGREASSIALRCCKLMRKLVDGIEQRDAARDLGVSERTAKRDAARLRDAVEAGALDSQRVDATSRYLDAASRDVSAILQRAARAGGSAA